MEALLLRIVDTFFLVYMIMIFIRILGSWFPDFQDSTWFRFLAFYTDPYLSFFRSFIPPIGMFDFSPLVAFFALQLLEYLTKSLIITLF